MLGAGREQLPQQLGELGKGEPEVRGEVLAEEMVEHGFTELGSKKVWAKKEQKEVGDGYGRWPKLTVSSTLDGAHTLTCALMLLNTDLHGHVSGGMREPESKRLSGFGRRASQTSVFLP